MRITAETVQIPLVNIAPVRKRPLELCLLKKPAFFSMANRLDLLLQKMQKTLWSSRTMEELCSFSIWLPSGIYSVLQQGAVVVFLYEQQRMKSFI